MIECVVTLYVTTKISYRCDYMQVCFKIKIQCKKIYVNKCIVSIMYS